MSLVKRNILANLIGGGLLAIMMIALTPLQIGILGMEAYAIIGFITTLQVAFTAFDLGLSSTLTREIASDQSAGGADSRSLVQTAMTVYWGGAVVIGLALASVAGPMSRSWFSASDIDVSTLETSVRVIALYLALRWPVALYVGILSGFQRMDLLNLLKVTSFALRMLGGILVLLQWRSLEAFLWWTVFSAVVEVMAFALAARRIYPNLPLRPGFSTAVVRRVWRFSLSMNLLAILAAIIVQIDRLVISKQLTLERLGEYNLAYTAALIIPQVVAAVGSAVLPWLTAAHVRGTAGELAKRYRDADQVMLFLVGIVAFTLIAYGAPLLSLWVGKIASSASVLPLAVLGIAFWLAAIVANLYNIAIAKGEPNIYLKANLIAIIPYFVIVVVLTGRFGIVGTAFSWVILYLYYAAAIVRQIHTGIGVSTAGWLTYTVVPSLMIGVVAFILPSLAWHAAVPDSSPQSHLPLMLVSLVLYIALFALTIGRSRMRRLAASLMSALRR